MLSDRDLHKLATETDFISPFNPDYCEGATINLTLSPLIKRYSSERHIVLGMEMTENLYETINIKKQPYNLKPHESVLIQTNEFLRMPDNLSGRIYERFSVKSLGLLISPAHYINPGYRGQVSLLAYNTNNVPITLVPGIKICQIGLFELNSEPLKPYEKQDAKYMDARTVSISKLHMDKEIQEFLREKGIKKVSEEMAQDLGKHLMSHIKKSAKSLADIAQEEFLKDE